MSCITDNGRKLWLGADQNAEGELVCSKCGSKDWQIVKQYKGLSIYGYTFYCQNGHAIKMEMKRAMAGVW